MDVNGELLLFLNSSSKMGIDSSKKLLKLLKDKDNKIKGVIESTLKEYESFYKRSEELLKKFKIEERKHEFMAKMSADMAMTMEIDKDNSDSKVADILIRGLKSGEIEIEKKNKNYVGKTNRKLTKLCEDYIKFQKHYESELEKYL